QETKTGWAPWFWTATGRLRRLTLKCGSGASQMPVAETLMVRVVAADASTGCRRRETNTHRPAEARARGKRRSIMDVLRDAEGRLDMSDTAGAVFFAGVDLGHLDPRRQ